MINFMKYRYLFFGISLVIIIPGLVSLILFGLRPSIDFTGGSLLEIRFLEPNGILPSELLTQEVAPVYDVTSVQSSGVGQYVFRGETINNEVKDQAVELLQQQYGQVELLRFETVGPILGRELIVKTIAAVLLAATAIAIYIAYQFRELRYGICAVLAMLHDVLVILGIFSLLGHFANVEVDILFVTALLTSLSFSVHDTIVVFDRIREFRRHHPRAELSELINAAILQTLGRSLNNSITIILMLTALVLLGGDTIRWFAIALLVGAITGTYSSTFTAAPLLLEWDLWSKRLKNRKKVVV